MRPHRSRALEIIKFRATADTGAMIDNCMKIANRCKLQSNDSVSWPASRAKSSLRSRLEYAAQGGHHFVGETQVAKTFE